MKGMDIRGCDMGHSPCSLEAVEHCRTYTRVYEVPFFECLSGRLACGTHAEQMRFLGNGVTDLNSVFCVFLNLA
jgi:hypothetical protein